MGLTKKHNRKIWTFPGGCYVGISSKHPSKKLQDSQEHKNCAQVLDMFTFVDCFDNSVHLRKDMEKKAGKLVRHWNEYNSAKERAGQRQHGEYNFTLQERTWWTGSGATRRQHQTGLILTLTLFAATKHKQDIKEYVTVTKEDVGVQLQMVSTKNGHTEPLLKHSQSDFKQRLAADGLAYDYNGLHYPLMPFLEFMASPMFEEGMSQARKLCTSYFDLLDAEKENGQRTSDKHDPRKQFKTYEPVKEAMALKQRVMERERETLKGDLDYTDEDESDGEPASVSKNHPVEELDDDSPSAAKRRKKESDEVLYSQLL